ncbi:hypothetical protein PAPYR_10270 [Paratrimastix pyriformis]|uniref:Lebercilin domain-containing protein n=1 Tax=Paratrimastix pyriformis TaxID=342808 RepID=A0ABQ8UAK1_9EUKA|nr:hypothetical protein PAPYR_10270 [Paratrimastix pyriformis]
MDDYADDFEPPAAAAVAPPPAPASPVPDPATETSADIAVTHPISAQSRKRFDYSLQVQPTVPPDLPTPPSPHAQGEAPDVTASPAVPPSSSSSARPDQTYDNLVSSLREEIESLRQRNLEYQQTLDALTRLDTGSAQGPKPTADRRDLGALERAAALYQKENAHLRKQLEKGAAQTERIAQLENGLADKSRLVADLSHQIRALEKNIRDKEKALEDTAGPDEQARLMATLHNDMRVLRVRKYHERHREDQRAIKKLEARALKMAERLQALKEQVPGEEPDRPAPAPAAPEPDPRDTQIEELQRRVQVAAHAAESDRRRHQRDLAAATQRAEAAKAEQDRLAGLLAERDKELKLCQLRARGGKASELADIHSSITAATALAKPTAAGPAAGSAGEGRLGARKPAAKQPAPRRGGKLEPLTHHASSKSPPSSGPRARGGRAGPGREGWLEPMAEYAMDAFEDDLMAARGDDLTMAAK